MTVGEVLSEGEAVPPKPLSRLRLSAYAVAFVLLGQQIAWRAGDLAIVVAQRGAARQLAAPAATLAALFLGLLLASFSWSRRLPGRRERRRLLSAMTAALVLGYVVLQALVSAFLPVAPFHGLYTWRLRSVVESSPIRPRVTYHLSSLGFRGPEWGPGEPGVTRVALIGDSYVFGSGVEAGDTLDRALAAALPEIAPGRRFEVLNLGMPGNNIAAHARLYAIAAEHLDVGAVVIGLTLPNDLSRIEPTEQVRALVRPSLTGLSMYLFGPSWVTLVSDLASLETSVNDAGLAWLDEHLAEIARIHERYPRTSVFLFPFRTPDPRISAVLGRHPDVPLIPTTPAQDDDRHYLPGDGHPNAEGNRLFARIIGRALVEAGGPASGE